MPPGANMLMKGLGMRGTGRYIGNQKSGRDGNGNYNRPRHFWHAGDGQSYPVPFLEYHPYMTDEDRALLTPKYFDDPLRNSRGLSVDYVKRLFQYERSQWPRLGYISPYRYHWGRGVRDGGEFKLWLYWHPRQEALKAMIDENYDRGYERPYGWIDDDALPRGGPLGVNGLYDHRREREPYLQRRGAANYHRPPHRQHGLVDYRDPRYRPPYPGYGANGMHRGRGHQQNEIFDVRRPGHPRRYSVGGRIQSPDFVRRPLPVQTRRRQGQFGQPLRNVYAPMPRRRRPLIIDELDPRNDDRPVFIRHRHGHHPRRDEFEDNEFEDIESLPSNESYIRRRRLSPNIVYPDVAPYHGRPLRPNPRRHGHHEVDTDDEDVDGIFRRRDGHSGRRRPSFGLGREGGGLKHGRRGFEDEEDEYGFSGDEDDIFDL